MKVEKAETKFTPVVITLESQAEVDAMLICLNTNYKKFEDQSESIGVEISQDRVRDAAGEYGSMFHALLRGFYK